MPSNSDHIVQRKIMQKSSLVLTDMGQISVTMYKRVHTEKKSCVCGNLYLVFLSSLAPLPIPSQS
jgi:hypothetical protein